MQFCVNSLMNVFDAELAGQMHIDSTIMVHLWSSEIKNMDTERIHDCFVRHIATEFSFQNCFLFWHLPWMALMEQLKFSIENSNVFSPPGQKFSFIYFVWFDSLLPAATVSVIYELKIWLLPSANAGNSLTSKKGKTHEMQQLELYWRWKCICVALNTSFQHTHTHNAQCTWW